MGRTFFHKRGIRVLGGMEYEMTLGELKTTVNAHKRGLIF
jgi:hypothetical protein